MLKHDKLKDALQYSYKLLTRKPYSEKKLADKLLKRGIDSDTTTQVIKHLRDYNFLNDRDFADRWLDIHINIYGWGPFKLRYGLMQQGINTTIIDDLLVTTFPDQDAQINVCMDVLKKYLKTHDLKLENRRNKVFNYLKQRGFSTQVILECLNNLTEMDSVF